MHPSRTAGILFACVALAGAAILFPALANAAGTAGSRVLLVVNTRSADSRSIGAHYAAKRGLPAANVFRISVPDSERTTLAEYHANIRKPLVSHIQKHKLNDVDFIVTTKGVPLMDERGYSVDSMLTGCLTALDQRKDNPYFGQNRPFSSKEFRMFLVTRLDGYTAADAKSLVDRSLKAQGGRGKILLDIDPYQDTRDGYRDVNKDIREAALRFIERRTPYILESSDKFAGGYSGLMGYYSWGSNDTHFNKEAYLSLRFAFGAIAETVVSTSARTFRPTSGGQSLIADLVRNGVTGVKGYASEPYSVSMARAQILFPRYLSGYNLAESFYMASPFIGWKDVVIGDPLCAPYAQKK